MKLAALISGGKDSLYATYLARKEGHTIDAIISFKSENSESYMFHVPNIDLVGTQAELMGIRLVQRKTKGEKEKELEDIYAIVSVLPVDGIVTGAVASNYQKERIDSICRKVGVKSIAPLWHTDPEKYLRDLVSNGFEVLIVSVAAPPLDEKWLGRKIDEKVIDELVKLNDRYGISLVGEGGEFDTFVTSCPMFSKRIIIEQADKNWDAKTRSGTLLIKKIRVE